MKQLINIIKQTYSDCKHVKNHSLLIAKKKKSHFKFLNNLVITFTMKNYFQSFEKFWKTIFWYFCATFSLFL